MALSDPQTLNAQTLARTGLTETGGTFRSSDGTGVLKVQHAYGRRTRRTIRFEHSKIAADVLTAQNTRVSATVYMVIDTPVDGYTVSEQKDLVAAFAAWLTAGTNANTVKVLGGEA